MAQDDGRTGGPEPSRQAGAAPRRVPAPAVVLAPVVVAGLLAVLFLVLAVVLPDPGRHARGLLIVVDLVSVVGVAAAWIRVVRLVGGSATRERVE